MIASFISAVIATFAGAYFAFKLQSNSEKNRNAIARNLAGDQQLFVLYRQLNTLLNLKRHFDQTNGNPQQYILMQPLSQLDTKGLNVDIEALSFLLPTQHKKILFELDSHNEKFLYAVECVNQRSRVHQDQAQPKLDAANFDFNNRFTDQQMENVLGKRLMQMLPFQTKASIDAVDDGIASLEEIAKRLHAALTNSMPSYNFTRIEDID